MPVLSSWNTPVVLPLTKRSISFFVVQRQVIEVDLLAAGRFDELQAIVNQGERLETEKVELDQADLFDPGHFVLGDDAAFFIDKQRQVIDQRQVGQAPRRPHGSRHGAPTLRAASA